MHDINQCGPLVMLYHRRKDRTFKLTVFILYSLKIVEKVHLHFLLNYNNKATQNGNFDVTKSPVLPPAFTLALSSEYSTCIHKPPVMYRWQRSPSSHLETGEGTWCWTIALIFTFCSMFLTILANSALCHIISLNVIDFSCALSAYLKIYKWYVRFH